MARDYIEIGSTPPGEPCVQIGDENYSALASAECQRYIKKLREFFGPEPEGAELRIKSFPHDFGSYKEVVCYYNDNNEASAEYAFRCESDGPEYWHSQPEVETEEVVLTT